MVIMILCRGFIEVQRILMMCLTVLTIGRFIRLFIGLQYNSLSSLVTWTAIMILRKLMWLI